MPLLHTDTLPRRIGRGALSLAAGVGNAFDLPHSILRDVVTLHNPLDQLLTPFSSDNRITTRDALRQYGLIGQKDTWTNFVPSLALEVATDPLFAFSGGFATLKPTAALGKAGQVAQKAGVLDEALRAAKHVSDPRLPTMGPREAVATLTPKQISVALPGAETAMAEAAAKMGVSYIDIADQPLGGFAKFTSRPYGSTEVILGQGGNSPLLPLMKTLDRVGERVRWSAPVRTAAGVFDTRNAGLATRVGQETAQRMHAATQRLDQATREAAAPHIRTFEEAGVFDDFNKELEVWRAIEQINVRQVADNDVGMTSEPFRFNPGQFTSKTGVDVTPQMQSAVDDISSAYAKRLEAERAAGLKLGDLDDYMARYAARSPQFLSGAWSRGYKGSRRVLPLAHPFQRKRNEALTNIPGGTAVLQQLSIDPEFSGVAHKIAPDKLTDTYWKGQVEKLKASPIYKEINPKAVDGVDLPKTIADESLGDLASEERLLKLVKAMGHLDPEHASKQRPMYQSPLVSFMRRMEYGEKAVQGSNIVISVLANAAKGTADPGDIRVDELLANSGLTPTAIERINEELLPRGLKAGNAWVSKEIAADVGRVTKPFTNPDEVDAFFEYFYDPLTALYKGSLTTPWLAFHNRNLMSGQIQNYLAGLYQSMQAGLGAVKSMDSLLRGGSIDDADVLMGRKGMDKAEATRALADQMFTRGVTGKHGVFQDYAGPSGDATRTPSVLQEIPGLHPAAKTMKESVQGAWRDIKGAKGVKVTGIDPRQWDWGDWNPLRQRGVATAENEFILSQIGDRMGHYYEALNRGAPFIDLLRQGYSMDEAARRVKAAQVDYTTLSATEKMYLKRAFPFYAFSKGAAEFLVDELATKPGGRLSQAIQVSNMLRGDAAGMPDYVSQSTAIDMGETSDGSRSYITGLGLMHEDPLSLGGIRNGVPSLRDTGVELLSRLNPILKGPLEWSVGESFFQRGPMGGRDLADLDPTVGRIMTNLGIMQEGPNRKAPPFISSGVEHLLANSPLSRLLTTARVATDPRKWEGKFVLGDKVLARLATGIHVTDVSPAAQDAVIRDELFSQIRESGGNVFERAYYPKNLPLTAEQVQNSDLAKWLAERAKQRAAARKAESVQSP